MYQVLLVDDQDIIRRMIKRFQIWGQSSGFVIAAEASNGEEAMLIARTTPIDVIITDIRMPRIDGLELLQQVMSSDICKYVILISEHAEFEYARKGIQYGAFGYLVKPVKEFDLQELLSKIDSQMKELKHLLEIESNEERGKSNYTQKQDIQVVIQYLLQEKVDEAILATSKILESIQLIHGDVWKIRMKEIEKIYKELSAFFENKYKWLSLITDSNRYQENIENMIWLSEANEKNCSQVEEIVYDYIREMGAIINRFQYTTGNNPVIRETITYILDHVDHDITVAEVANQVHVNVTYLSNLFSQKTGFTIKEFMVRVKMERAKRLLQEGQLKTYEIAQRLGYADSEYFSKAFKKQLGITPTQFRQNPKKSGNNYK